MSPQRQLTKLAPSFSPISLERRSHFARIPALVLAVDCLNPFGFARVQSSLVAFGCEWNETERFRSKMKRALVPHNQNRAQHIRLCSVAFGYSQLRQGEKIGAKTVHFWCNPRRAHTKTLPPENREKWFSVRQLINQMQNNQNQPKPTDNEFLNLVGFGYQVAEKGQKRSSFRLASKLFSQPEPTKPHPVAQRTGREGQNFSAENFSENHLRNTQETLKFDRKTGKNALRLDPKRISQSALPLRPPVQVTDAVMVQGRCKIAQRSQPRVRRDPGAVVNNSTHMSRTAPR